MLQRSILRSGRFATIGGRGQRVASVRLGVWRWPVRIAMLLYLGISSILPLVALAIVSVQPFWSATIDFEQMTGKHYVSLFERNSLAWDGLRNSIMLGIAGATLGMLIAAIVSFYVAQKKGSMVATLVDGATKLPAAVSHLVIGIAFILAFAGPPFHMHGTIIILLLAYLVLYIPQASLTAGSALAQVGRELVEASLISGASNGATFMRVTLPLMLSGLAAGWTMLFVLTAGDITASAMLAGTRNPVAGFVILDLWTNGSFPPLAAFAMILTVLMATVVLASLWWTSRRR
jgi:iron(III) transport system permease protein